VLGSEKDCEGLQVSLGKGWLSVGEFRECQGVKWIAGACKGGLKKGERRIKRRCS